jgi:hypothetical protein
MPMNESRHVELVFDAYAKLFSDLCDEARRAVRLANAEHRGRLSVDFDAAPLDAQDRKRPASLQGPSAEQLPRVQP